MNPGSRSGPSGADLGVVVGHQPAHRDPPVEVHPLEHLARDRPADVLEVDVDPVGDGRLEVVGERGGAVVQRDVEAELVQQGLALLLTAGDPDRTGALDLRDLADRRADRAGGRGDHDGLARLRPADLEESGVRREARHAEHAEGGGDGHDGRVEPAQAGCRR